MFGERRAGGMSQRRFQLVEEVLYTGRRVKAHEGQMVVGRM